MNIGIDAGCLGVRDARLKVGVYTFAKNLFLELGKIDKKNTYFLYSFYPIEESLLGALPQNMKNIVVGPTIGWMKVWLPLRMQKDKIDVFLALGQALPPVLLKKTLTIGYIYDLAFEKYPEFYPDSYKKLHANTQSLVRKSNHIITISETTKKDIIDYFHISNKKISAISLGLKVLNTSQEKKNTVSRKYFLYVGALKRVKNVASIIRAFALFQKTSKEVYDLYIIGGDKWIDPKIEIALSEVPNKTLKHIYMKGFVDDMTLTNYYTHATAFVSPSFYEGFGLSHLEAMALGCPVLGSTSGSLPEVVGDAGILVDPNNILAIANAMIVMAENKRKKADYVRKGRIRAKNYSWKSCAQKTLAVIKNNSKTL